LFNWKLGSVTFIYFISIEFFIHFENDSGYLGSFYLLSFIEFTLSKFLNWYYYFFILYFNIRLIRIIFSQFHPLKFEFFLYRASWFLQFLFYSFILVPLLRSHIWLVSLNWFSFFRIFFNLIFFTFYPSILSFFRIKFLNLFRFAFYWVIHDPSCRVLVGLSGLLFFYPFFLIWLVRILVLSPLSFR
jgi:hypothetical protein